MNDDHLLPYLHTYSSVLEESKRLLKFSSIIERIDQPNYTQFQRDVPGKLALNL